MKRRLRTHAILDGVAYVHPFAPYRRAVLADVHLVFDRRWLLGLARVRHGDVGARVLRYKAIRRGDDGLWRVVSRITRPQRRRANIDHKSGNFVWTQEINM